MWHGPGYPDPIAVAQSKTLTLEEISQKLEELEAYQKKMEAQLEARHKKIVADRDSQEETAGRSGGEGKRRGHLGQAGAL